MAWDSVGYAQINVDGQPIKTWTLEIAKAVVQSGSPRNDIFIAEASEGAHGIGA